MNENQLNIILKSVQQNSKVLIVNCDAISASDVKLIGDFCSFVCIATDNSLAKESLQHKMKSNRDRFAFSSTSKIPNLSYDVLVFPYLNVNYANKFLNSIKTLRKIVLLNQMKILHIADSTNKGQYAAVYKNNVDVDQLVLVDDKKQIKKPVKCSFFVVNYNTSNLINILLYSIRTFVKSFDYDIWIFDNSDKEKLELEDSTNVHILDNTHGQLIDYDAEIKRYCNTSNTGDVFAGSTGINGFVSLRHILAIQYGFDYDKISDNMIICDSDIILKKDIDYLNEECALIGTVRLDGYNQRMLPFLCYVNKKLVKAAKINYFNPLKMRGCKDKNNHTIIAYDTGGSILEDCKLKKLPMKLVNIDNYCVHFGGSSREDLTTRFLLNTMFDVDVMKENLVKHKVFVNAYDYSKMNDKSVAIYEQALSNYSVASEGNKYVVYTCITGNYDGLIEQQNFEHEKFDYICFTNSPKIKQSKNWKIVNISGIENVIGEPSQQKISRFIKTHPHLFLKNYEKSLYIDGNIKVLSNDLENDFMKFINDEEYLLTSQHPCISNVYEEINACIMKKKDDEVNLNKMRAFLETENFNDYNAHTQMGIIARNHNNKECQKIMDDWWQMIKNYCKRDQTSFNYVMWKNQGRFLSLPFDYVKKYFAILGHN